MVQSKHLYLRLIQLSDIDLLMQLRLNKNLNQYLNKISDDSAAQLDWLNKNKQRETKGSDYYFVIVDKNEGEVGLIRVYEINESDKSFTWGSWILREYNRPSYAAIESILLMYEFAFNELGLLKAQFMANNDNAIMLGFSTRFGATKLFADDVRTHFEITKIQYIQLKYNQYYKFLVI